MNSFAHFKIWVLTLCMVFQSGHGFYLPGSYPHKHGIGDTLSVKVNSITSIETEIPFSYYSLPFCKPLEGVKDSAENLGEVLMGDRIENSPYKFKMYTNESDIFQCQTDPLSGENFKLLKKRIDEMYQVNLILDNLPAIRYAKKESYFLRWTGYPAGIKIQDSYYVFNHLKFTVLVHKYEEANVAHVMGTGEAAEVIPTIASGGSELPGYMVVGFEVVPCSVMHDAKSVKNLKPYEKYPSPVKCDPTTVAMPIKENEPIVFTYEVTFEESDIKWPSRWDAYLKMEGSKVHWFSILNSLMVITFLAGIVLVIFLRTVRRDLTRYEELDKEAQAQMNEELSGWKLVVGDVFRAPTNAGLLCVMVGDGVQLLGMAVVTVMFAALGFMSPASRGTLIIGMILFYMILGISAGYVAVRLWRTIGCGDKKGWVSVSWKGILRVSCSTSGPLKVMISGAPASGKGTQCELIVKKFGLVHISTGDLLRAEVSAETEIGNKAKEFMNAGRLVPDEIVTAMVTARLSLKDAKEKGWLLDGYPRSSAQAESLEKLNVRPDIYVVLDVPDEILIDRCVGRRLDPETGKIYHVKNFPPETEEIKARLITRPDDTEEKVKARLDIYKKNAEAILSTYSNIMVKIDGNRSKEVVFKEIDSLLSQVHRDEVKLVKSVKSENSVPESGSRSSQASVSQDKWRGIPTRLNNIPHSREIRNYFYDDVLQATKRAVNDGRTRLRVDINIPELNPEMDVYRIGTLMELVRVIALSFSDDGKHVKVCVQGSMGKGALAGMPLQLAGTRNILEFMDWGDYGAKGTFIKIGSIGEQEVSEEDDMFILVAPQNAVGNCIIDDLKAMTVAAGSRPVILINPRLKDLPGSSGIMQTMGRDKRLEYAASFESCYFFRLLYYAGTQYPIMGALRMSYPYRYELYKRVDQPSGTEKYVILSTFSEKPSTDDVNDAFMGIPRNGAKKASGFWGFLSSVF